MSKSPTNLLANWPKEAGPKPTRRELDEAVKIGVTPGTSNQMAIAMTLRQNGATRRQIIEVLGKPHRNVITRLLKQGAVRQQASYKLEALG